MKKIIAAAAAICMTAAAMPLQGAVFADGETQIGAADDFKAWIADGAVTDAVLIGDIDLGGEITEPVGTFNNTLDGGGYKIKGLNINKPDGQGAFFNEIGTAGVVKNLTIEGEVSAKEAAGIAVTNNGNITDVKTEITVFGHDKAAGAALTNGGTISGSDNTGDVSITDDNSFIAGIACENTGAVSGCANYGVINGRISNGGAEFAGGICAFSSGLITGCANAGTVSGVDLKYTDTVNNNVSSATDIGGAGGIAGVSDGTIESSVNSGFINGNGYINIGGISGFSAGEITSSSNYGEISSYAHNDDALDTNVPADEYEVAATGGIAGLAKANVENAANYGKVSGDTRTGGIAGAAAGAATEIKDSVNYGRIDGSDTQGGIAGEVNGTITGCTNYGEIHGNKKYTGGVAGRLKSGAMELCANNGAVSGAESNEPTDNFTGGVVGRADKANTPIKNVYNTVEISAPFGSNGGAGCDLNTDITGFVINLGERNIDGNKGNKNFDTTKFFWRDSDWGENWPADITAQLNAAGGDVWVDGPAGYPVFKKDAQPAAGKTYVKTAEALADALIDENDADIVIDGTIEIISNIPVTGTKTLSGGKLILEDCILTVVTDSALTLGNISIQTSSADGASETAAPAVKVNGGSLTVSGIVDTNASIAGEAGAINLTGIWCDSAENAENPSVTASGGMTFEHSRQYQQDGTNYYMYVSQSADIVTGITAFAADNASLQFDVQAYISGNEAKLFMPGTADLSSVTFKGVNDNGEAVTGNVWTEDLSAEKAVENVRIGGFDYTVSAMQSALPALSFSIDEQYGTINAMNTSADHDVKCYGDVDLYVPDALKESKGWEDISSTQYQDKDPNKAPGTMEIKGRGNTTWVPDLTTKKPYQFKFEKKADVLGMGANKTWIILKNDGAYIRNKLAFDLGAEMGLDNTSKGEFVDVYMNGEYLGNYLLCEKVQVAETRVNITDLDDAYEVNGDSVEGLDLTGGYLLEIDNWGGDPLQIKYDEGGPNENIISIKSPEDLAKSASPDESNPYSYIYNYTTDFFDAVYGDGTMSDGASYLEHIDVDSFVKYFWHQEFLRNGDCGIGSTYLYKDAGADSPIYAGPIWDNDRAINSGSTVEKWTLKNITRPSSSGVNSVSFYNRLSRRPDFAALAVEYYKKSNLKDVFAKASGHIDEYNNYAGDSFKMDELRWNVTPEDTTWLKGMLDDRAAWLETDYATLLTEAMAETDTDTYVITDVTDKTATVTGKYSGADTSAALVGALYNSDGTLVETKTSNERIADGFTKEITFDNNPSDYTLKVFIWNGMGENGMKPVFNTPAAVSVPRGGTE